MGGYKFRLFAVVSYSRFHFSWKPDVLSTIIIKFIPGSGLFSTLIWLVLVTYHSCIEGLHHSLQAHPATLLSACWLAHTLWDTSVDQSVVAVVQDSPMSSGWEGWRLCLPTYFSAGRDRSWDVELGWRVLYKSSSVHLYWLSWNKEVLFSDNNLRWCNAGHYVWRVVIP